jgi:hypothetical protein
MGKGGKTVNGGPGVAARISAPCASGPGLAALSLGLLRLVGRAEFGADMLPGVPPLCRENSVKK